MPCEFLRGWGEKPRSEFLNTFGCDVLYQQTSLSSDTWELGHVGTWSSGRMWHSTSPGLLKLKGNPKQRWKAGALGLPLKYSSASRLGPPRTGFSELRHSPKSVIQRQLLLICLGLSCPRCKQWAETPNSPGSCLSLGSVPSLFPWRSP